MRRNKLFVVLAVIMVVSLLAGCAPKEKLATTLNWNLGTEPPTIDPQLATDTTSVDVDAALFLGLTDIDPDTAAVIPELATEWSASADGLVWTFKMRNDAYWVSYDPSTGKAKKERKITAHDVEYGVKRCINPETASDYAYVLYIIKNGEAVNTGESTDLDSVGVKAVDDTTVEFTLEQPAGYFPNIAGMWVCYPVPKEVIDAHGDKWTEPGNVWTCGPYVLDTWEHENKMVMKKNPYWWGAKDVAIEEINCVMVVEASTAFAMYENGELDVQDVPLEDMDRVKADPELSKELYIAPRLCTYYYGFNVTKPPTDNVLVRKALSYAIDRQKLIDTVTKGGQLPANSFACPGIFGSPWDNPDYEGPHFDAALAKQYLAEAGYPDGAGFPEMTLMFNTSEGHQKIAQFIQGQWKEHLGIDVKLANQEWKVYLKTLSEDSPQVWRLGWCADYTDENNWVHEVFNPRVGANRAKWPVDDPAAIEFMALTEGAAKETDPEKRKEMYLRAETILTNEFVTMIPIYFYTRVVCTKPYVERVYMPLGGQGWHLWKVLAH